MQRLGCTIESWSRKSCIWKRLTNDSDGVQTVQVQMMVKPWQHMVQTAISNFLTKPLTNHRANIHPISPIVSSTALISAKYTKMLRYHTHKQARAFTDMKHNW